jgi:DNA topoisomerase VI subunit B
MVLKELVDNALDACEEAGVAPLIKIVVNDNGITISDNGPGIPASTVQGLLNYSVRMSSREAYVSPTRGAQGNALQTILAVPFALDGGHGRADISALGQRHEISFRVDHIEQRPIITPAVHPENVKTGTTIKIWWPAECMETLRNAEDEFLQLAGAYAWLNPDLSLSRGVVRRHDHDQRHDHDLGQVEA